MPKGVITYYHLPFKLVQVPCKLVDHDKFDDTTNDYHWLHISTLRWALADLPPINGFELDRKRDGIY